MSEISQDGPELFIGLVGPVGTDLGMVMATLTDELQSVGYRTVEIRLSRLLRELQPNRHLDDMVGQEDNRIDAHMDAGNELRRTVGDGGALALLAAARVTAERARLSGQARLPAPRTAYVFNSLKHPGEVEALRKLYGSGFLCLGIYAPRHLREQNLAKIIAEGRALADKAEMLDRARELVDKDEKTPGDRFGQNVRGAFPLADVFLRGDRPEHTREDMRRTVRVVFGDPFITPTQQEYGMFQARAAALRSADLSRQVGAAIAAEDGEVVALGCNEVPKAGGGIYWTGDDHDSRDFTQGGDLNAKTKRRIVAEILKELQDKRWLTGQRNKIDVDALVAEALDAEEMFEDSRLSGILEFGRIVHAEMNALMDAGRRGIRTVGSKLYCTTFPCHVCARHILAAGITEVYYIEPYPKSMAKDMYAGAIVVEGLPADTAQHPGAVRFEAFVGIAPSRYMELFGHGKRKDERTGLPVDWTPKTAVPRIRRALPTYLDVEVLVGARLARLTAAKDLLTPGDDGLAADLAAAATDWDDWAAWRRAALRIEADFALVDV